MPKKKYITEWEFFAAVIFQVVPRFIEDRAASMSRV
jgi:hypothetical protein